MGIAYAADWTVLTTFSGTSDQTTTDFHVSTNEWRIVWSITPDPENMSYAFFGVYVHQKGASWDMASASNYDEKTNSILTNGILDLHVGVGDYFLNIETANLAGYTLKVEYDPTAPSPSPSPSEDTSATSNYTTFAIATIVTSICAGSLIAVIYIIRKRKSR
jgi:hypothetical protein